MHSEYGRCPGKWLTLPKTFASAAAVFVAVAKKKKLFLFLSQ
jgi:hypothetical protein